MTDVSKYINELRRVVNSVSVRDAHDANSKGALLIDIREKEEAADGCPAGAIRIQKGLLEMRINNIAPRGDEQILLLCAAGTRSLISAFCLNQMGYRNVSSVEGGFAAWKNAGLEFYRPKVLSEVDIERYKRHIIIPEILEKGQIKLGESRVLVVGAGGIGSPAAWYLAAAGVGRIGIVDDDIVDRSNLQRQILHTDKSVGTSKVLSAKERLTALNPSIEINALELRLNESNIEGIFNQYDLIIDGTDNFDTRYLINDACVKLKKPNVHGSVFRFEGQVSVFWPQSPAKLGPCYRCIYPEPPPPELAQSCAEAGVLGVLPGTIGTLCATEAIKLLLNIGTPLVGRLLSYNALNMEFDIYEIQANKECKYCACSDRRDYPAYSNYGTQCKIEPINVVGV